MTMLVHENPLKQLDRDRLLHPPDRIAAFVRRVAGRSYGGSERRSRERHRLPLPVIAVPVTEDCEPVDEAFRTFTRDLSTSGVGLLHTRPVNAGYLAVEIGTRDGDGRGMQVLVRVLRCRRINDHLYDIGGQFITRLNGDSSAGESGPGDAPPNSAQPAP
ncbi:MAG TPA: PilZ domain-containing protein [Planctomycetaceae bacterium]|nr:PilZ domain-containing protein [Planctomycetaceae bacterium]